MKYELLGDVHGKTGLIHQRLRITHHPIIQLGDLGFGEDWHNLRKAPKDRLRVVSGNHDATPSMRKSPYWLGDFGLLSDQGLPTGAKVFFVRGAWSIDKDQRIPGKSWWEDEELSWEESNRALDAYEAARPNVVLSHEAPLSASSLLLSIMGEPCIASHTSKLLQTMLDIHKPERWYHGHYHFAHWYRIGPTLFRCLASEEFLEVDL